MFDAPDALWVSFTTKIAEYVNTHGGYAHNQIQTTQWRPNWNAVKDMLISDVPITSIPCD